MNSPILCEKDYVSVVPRIIDPKMKFTKESIENTFDNNRINVENVKEGDYKKTNNTTNNISNNMSNSKKEDINIDINTTTSFVSDYKYIIILVIIAITIILIYLIYKYYKSNPEIKDVPKDTIKDVPKEDEPKEIKTKEKAEQVNSYLSSYIQDDDEETPEVSVNTKVEYTNSKNTNSMNMDMSDNIPMDNINTSNVEEIIETMPKHVYKFENSPGTLTGLNSSPRANNIMYTGINYDNIDDMQILQHANTLHSKNDIEIKDSEIDTSKDDDKEYIEDGIEEDIEEDYKSLLDDCDTKSNDEPRGPRTRDASGDSTPRRDDLDKSQQTSSNSNNDYQDIFKTNELLDEVQTKEPGTGESTHRTKKVMYLNQ